MTKQEYLSNRKQQIEEYLKPIKKNDRLYSLLRLLSAVLMVVLLIYADQKEKIFGFGLAFVLLIFFLILVKKHQVLRQQLDQLEAQLHVIAHLQKRLDGTWMQETCCIDPEKEDTVAIDLDLFGNASLYQFMNQTASPIGKYKLRDLFTKQECSIDKIYERQTAVKELLKKQDWLLQWQGGCHMFHKDGIKIKEEDFYALLDYAKQRHTVVPSWLYIGSFLLTILTLFACVLMVLKVTTYLPFQILFVCNMIISLLCTQKVAPTFVYMRSLQQLSKDYAALFAYSQKETFASAYLCHLQTIMQEGSIGMQKLNGVSQFLVLRNNILSYFILSGFLPLDLWCLRSWNHWQDHYGISIEKWFEATAEMEVLGSLCVLGQVKEQITFPEIVESKQPFLEVEALKHPLLDETKAVANSFQTKAGSIILTGSNMSGKTTFLRTLGISQLLLCAGAPVCGKAMKATIMEVYTSMRVKDDVREGISTFYAELLRIRKMMDAMKRQKPMFILIDEIFKGTNSADRILCAETAIKKLHQPWIITMVSTHDFALCELEEDAQIQAINYHFSEYYVQDEIHFDYTLKKGRCTTTNAKELMRLAGI